MLTFNYRYFISAIALFIIEVLIALFVHDNFIRPYFGDYLVVILLYFAAMSFIKASPLKMSIAVLAFACFVEILQYFKITDRLGLAGNAIAKTVIGVGFDWWDIVAYFLGVISILIIAYFNKRIFVKSFKN